MIENKMIAYCGLDCERCDAYIATLKNDNVLREKVAKLWSELNGVEITSEMINCQGCRADGAKTPYCENLCGIRQCALGKQYDTCGNCSKILSCSKVSMIIGNNKEAKERLIKSKNSDL